MLKLLLLLLSSLLFKLILGILQLASSGDPSSSSPSSRMMLLQMFCFLGMTATNLLFNFSAALDWINNYSVLSISSLSAVYVEVVVDGRP